MGDWTPYGWQSCRGCDVYPRNPCTTAEEVAKCPNASEWARTAARRDLPGHDRDAEDELAEYRRRYGPLPGRR